MAAVKSQGYNGKTHRKQETVSTKNCNNPST